MTLKEMEKLLEQKPLACEPPLVAPSWQPLNYAQSEGLQLLECLKDKKCPVCGGAVSPELDLNDQSITTYWCSKHSGHIFQHDGETGDVDRIHFG